ncbi:MAG: membrane protein insertion efficiency factor YidD [Candidatus Omnitrophica bacterium]|nr:membrane protein insertion efficiency factor YidD [Candidatus Omnitrophota bacterium]
MLRRIALALLGIYQRYLRIILPSSCRFLPSCSEYARQAIEKYGILWGGIKATKRLLHCHPLSQKNGYDPLI